MAILVDFDQFWDPSIFALMPKVPKKWSFWDPFLTPFAIIAKGGI
jgi:hypothetical protein